MAQIARVGPVVGLIMVVLSVLVQQHRGQTVSAESVADQCGPTIYKPTGQPWVCTFDDEFSGTALDPTKWNVQTDFITGDTKAGYACYVDNPETVSVSSGSLHLTVRKTKTMHTCKGLDTSTPYTAGMVNSYQRFSQSYGRFEARMMTHATDARGLHEAFWLWPDDRYTVLNWPYTGEIDIAETYSMYPNLAIPYLHYGATDNDGGIKGVNTQWTCQADRGTWNTYTLVWTPQELRISINGELCMVNTAHPAAFAERYIVNLTSALGEGTNLMNDQTPIPATTKVDYVRVWR